MPPPPPVTPPPMLPNGAADEAQSADTPKQQSLLFNPFRRASHSLPRQSHQQQQQSPQQQTPPKRAAAKAHSLTLLPQQAATFCASDPCDESADTGRTRTASDIPTFRRDGPSHPTSPAATANYDTSYFASRSGSVGSGSVSPAAVKETRSIVRQVDAATGNKMVNGYMVLRELGRGVHGKVKLCFDTDSMEHYAMKIIPRATRRRFGQAMQDGDKVRSEIAVMKKCMHPNIVRLHEVIDDPAHHKLFLIMEYVDGGELIWRDEMENPVVPVDDAKKYFCDVLVGLEYLHYQGIVHRDIKPQNIMISLAGVAKIGDFGVSYFAETSLDNVGLAKTAGSPAFFAPELCVDRRGLMPTNKAVPPSNQMRLRTASSLSRRSNTDRSAVSSSRSLDSMREDSTPTVADIDDTNIYNNDDILAVPDAVSNAAKWAAKSAASNSGYMSMPMLRETSNTSVDRIPNNVYNSTSNYPPVEDASSDAIIAIDSQQDDLVGELSYPISGTEEATNEHTQAAITAPPIIGHQIDIWSLGVTLFCIVYGRLPFVANNEFELFAMITSQELEFMAPGFDTGPEDDDNVVHLLKCLLEKDPRKRISLADAKRHPWLNSAIPGTTEEEKAQWIAQSDPRVYGMRMASYGMPEYDKQGKIRVTDADVRGAVTMGAVRRIMQDIKKRISRSFTTLRGSGSGSKNAPSPTGSSTIADSSMSSQQQSNMGSSDLSLFSSREPSRRTSSKSNDGQQESALASFWRRTSGSPITTTSSPQPQPIQPTTPPSGGSLQQQRKLSTLMLGLLRKQSGEDAAALDNSNGSNSSNSSTQPQQESTGRPPPLILSSSQTVQRPSAIVRPVPVSGVASIAATSSDNGGTLSIGKGTISKNLQ